MTIDTVTLLKGSDVVERMVAKINDVTDEIKEKMPSLTIVRVGERPDDIAYEKGAVKRLTSLGIDCNVVALPADIQQKEFMNQFNEINDDKAVDGILLLRPLPQQLDVSEAERLIDPDKDVDGISPMNTARIYLGDYKGFPPCTAQAVMEIIDNMGYELRGKNVVIVGCGKVVGKPLLLLMLQRDATVTVCNEYTTGVNVICKKADILVAAAGVRRLITPDHVSSDCIVIDVGINVDENGNICGDVDFEHVAPIVKKITPVPGGVGTVTTYVLAKHVMRAAGIKL